MRRGHDVDKRPCLGEGVEGWTLNANWRAYQTVRELELIAALTTDGDGSLRNHHGFLADPVSHPDALNIQIPV